MKTMELYEAVRSVPENAKRRIEGGRLNGKTDINPMWRIKTLTEQFGPCGIGWYYKPVRKWTEAVGEEVAAFVDIELYVRVEGEWSMPVSGTGGSMLAEKERSGLHVSDECYKMATTDAISVACKQLGIGADVYWEADRTKYAPAEEGAKEAEPVETPEARQRRELMETLTKELNRTGYGKRAVMKTYKVDGIEKMSSLQLRDCTRKLKALPDKAVS